MIRILKQKNIHKGFQVSLILKGLFDVAEIFSGILMLSLSPERLNHLVSVISKEELLEDPGDLVMNYIISYSHSFTLSVQHFTSFYLLSHGSVKVIALILLWKKKLWAYPLSCIMFLTFIYLQIERFAHTFSIALLLVTLLDIIMLILTILEYKNISQLNKLNQ